MDTTDRIRELLLRARDLEQQAEGCRAEARRLIEKKLMREARRAARDETWQGGEGNPLNDPRDAPEVQSRINDLP